MIQLTGFIREVERLAVIPYVICGARECSVCVCHISGKAPLVGHTQNGPIWVPRAKPLRPYVSINLQKWTDVAQLQQFLSINTKSPASPTTEHSLPQSSNFGLTVLLSSEAQYLEASR